MALLAARTDALTVVTEQMTDLVRRHVPRLGERVHYVPGGVDLDRFAPGPAEDAPPEPWPVPEGVPLFGLVTKLSSLSRKIDQALRAWSLLRARTELPFRAVILGDEGLLDPINALIRSAGLDGIAFAVHSRDMQKTDGPSGVFMEIMRRIDVGVQLTPGSDGTCRATLEIMALGRPSVVYGTGALAELVEDGQTGWVAPEDDPDALAAAMARLLEDSDLRETFGRAARARAMAHFGADAQMERMERVYQAALEGSH